MKGTFPRTLECDSEYQEEGRDDAAEKSGPEASRVLKEVTKDPETMR